MNNITVEKEKLRKKASRQMKIGIALTIFNILMIFTLFTSSNMSDLGVPGAILICLSLLGIGIWKILQSTKNKKVLTLFEAYKIRFTGSEVARDVEYSNIANIMGKNVDIVKKEVDRLIKYKLWEGVYGGESAMRSTMLSKISVECHSCGASLTVDMNNTGKMCEYCGASLADEIYSARYQAEK